MDSNKGVYVIIYGLNTCPDMDKPHGWVETEEEAKKYCEAHPDGEYNTKAFYQYVPHLSV